VYILFYSTPRWSSGNMTRLFNKKYRVQLLFELRRLHRRHVNCTIHVMPCQVLAMTKAIHVNYLHRSASSSYVHILFIFSYNIFVVTSQVLKTRQCFISSINCSCGIKNTLNNIRRKRWQTCLCWFLFPMFCPVLSC